MPLTRTHLARGAMGLLILISACGGTSERGLGPSTSSSTAPPETETVPTAEPEPTVAETTVTTAATTTIKERLKVQRPSGTPRGTVVPPGDDAYRLLAKGSCSELLRRVKTWPHRGPGGTNDPEANVVTGEEFFLYRAAGEACTQRWDEARRDYATLLKLKPTFDGGGANPCSEGGDCPACLKAAFEWLTAVLETHRKSPDVELVFVTGTKASPCPADDRSRGTKDPTSNP